MWKYNGKPLLETDIPEKSIGFLYRIIHLPSGKWYIGRKTMSMAATKTVKGVKKKIRKESDWKEYFSSSKEIQEMVSVEGEQNFERTILIFCETKAQMLYGEENLLHITGAMFDPLCFNSNIRAAIMKSWFNKCPTFQKELFEAVIPRPLP